MGNVYHKLGDFKKAQDNFQKSLKIATNNDYRLTEMDNYKSLYELHYINNNSKKALNFYQKYVSLRDSLFNNLNSEAFTNEISDEKLSLQLQVKVLKERVSVLLIVSIIVFLILVLMLIIQRIRIKQLN